MLKIIHRVNTTEFLKKIPNKYGVEIDLRSYKDTIILNHEPFLSGEKFEDYLRNYSHAFAVFNIKEAGIEDTVIKLAEKYHVNNYFLLDVEFPYIYRAARQGVKDIAIRYSEDEPIEAALKYKNLVDWVWIDTNTRLPLTKPVAKKLSGFKTCLVSPDRWGRPEDIPLYRKKIEALGIKLDAVMTALETLPAWEE